MDHTVVTLKTPHTCLYLVSVYQTAPPLTSSSSHLIAPYYSFINPPIEWKAELALLADLQRTVNGYPSAAGQVQARERLPVRDRRSTTELHH